MKKLIVLIILASCSRSNVQKPVYVEYFKNGQILLPDMLCNDTLIVVNAKELNKQMAYYEQGFNDFGDDQLDSVFHQYCKIK